eukprot:3029101-Pyramimonas_sp.AAC.1
MRTLPLGPSGGFGSFLWGHEALYWVGEIANLVFGTHAEGPTGAVGGPPDGATKRGVGCAGRMRTAAL